MALASWLCNNNTKNMVIKITYPGGLVELYDKPIVAAEIMHRNPKCCVTHPNVFREPSAVVSPDTVLMLGQKFYVVPISTIRKLRRLSSNNPHSPTVEAYSPRLTPRHQCHLNSYVRNLSIPNRTFAGRKQPEGKFDDASSSGNTLSSANYKVRRVHKLRNGCFKFLRAISKNGTGKEAANNETREVEDYSTPSNHWEPGLKSITEE